MSVVNHPICVFILQIFPMLRGHGLHSTTLGSFFVDKALSSMETSVHWVTVKPCVSSHLDVSVSPRRPRHLGITRVKSTLMKMRLWWQMAVPAAICLNPMRKASSVWIGEPANYKEINGLSAPTSLEHRLFNDCNVISVLCYMIHATLLTHLIDPQVHQSHIPQCTIL